MKKIEFEVRKNGELVNTFELENVKNEAQIISLIQNWFDPSLHTLYRLDNSLQVKPFTVLDDLPDKVILVILPKDSQGGGAYPLADFTASDMAKEEDDSTVYHASFGKAAGSENIIGQNDLGRPSPLLDRITLNPKVCFGKPTIRNMRYPVETILDLLSAGMTVEELLEDYPDIEHEDILACLAFAAKMIQVKSIHKVHAA